MAAVPGARDHRRPRAARPAMPSVSARERGKGDVVQAMRPTRRSPGRAPSAVAPSSRRQCSVPDSVAAVSRLSDELGDAIPCCRDRRHHSPRRTCPCARLRRLWAPGPHAGARWARGASGLSVARKRPRARTGPPRVVEASRAGIRATRWSSGPRRPRNGAPPSFGRRPPSSPLTARPRSPRRDPRNDRALPSGAAAPRSVAATDRSVDRYANSMVEE